MKQFKKLMALVLATALVVSMGVMAFSRAGATGQIQIIGTTDVPVAGKTFSAYKILDATYATNASGTPTTIAYTVPSQMRGFYKNYFNIDGASGTQTEDYRIIKAIEAIGQSSAEMQRFIKAAKAYIDANGSESSAIKAGPVEGDAGAVFSNLESGYYLIVDEDKDEPISALMLDTVLDEKVEIIIKANKTQVDKSIVSTSGSSDEVDRKSGTVLSTTEANNLGVGSTVNYQLIQRVPNHTGYEYFYYIIDDTMSNGLTFNNDIEVRIDINNDNDYEDTNCEVVKKLRISSGTDVVNTEETIKKNELLEKDVDYYVYLNEDGKTFKIAFADIMNYPIDRKIKVTYSANVNSNAITGNDPNTNTAQIEFSNNPSSGTKHDKPSGTSGSSKPGLPDTTKTGPMGTGPSDTTNTYTTEIKVIKTDANGDALTGAQFTLTGTSYEVVVKNQTIYVEDPSGTHWLLKTGKYTNEAPQTTPRMIAAPSGATSGYVKVEAGDDESDKAQWVTLTNGTKYRPYKAGEKKSVYILEVPNDDYYDSTVIKYKEDTVTTEKRIEVPVSKVITASGSNIFDFKQLGEGNYTLSETLVPEGYNKAEDIKFQIIWNKPNGEITSGTTCTWTISGTNLITDDNTLNGKANDGKFGVKIENRSGVELPSTGGIGTTIFYVLGAILVMFGGVLLVTKRRAA